MNMEKNAKEFQETLIALGLIISGNTYFKFLTIVTVQI